MSETAERLTIFISGAGRGIGHTTSEKLFSRSYTVGAFDISDDQKWTVDHQNAVAGTLGVTNPQQWEDALKQFVDRVEHLGILINNAGILYGTPFEEGPCEQDNVLIDVNMKGVHFGCHAALPYLKGSRGQIINLCSASVVYGTPDMATYSAAKFAVHDTMEVLEVEQKPHGTSVEAVWPLCVNTPMLENVSTSGAKCVGIRITSNDAANTIVDCINHKQGKITKVHFPIGLRTKLLYYAASVGAPFLNHFVNVKLTTRREIGL